jgi:hypothetical protein
MKNLVNLKEQLVKAWENEDTPIKVERELIDEIFCQLKVALTKIEDDQVQLLYNLADKEEKTDIDIICHGKLEIVNIRRCLNSNPELMVALYMHAPSKASSIWEGVLV